MHARSRCSGLPSGQALSANMRQASRRGLQEDSADGRDAPPFLLLQNLFIGQHQPKPTCVQDLF